MITYSCAICLDDWPDTQALRSLLCGHTFCDSCIRQHLQRTSACCPTCRAGPIRPHQVRPVFVTAEVQNRASQRPRARKHVLAVPLEVSPRLQRLSSDLQSLTINSRIDLHAIADDLLELLASDECNDTVKNILLGTLVTFLDGHAASAYEAARRGEVERGRADFLQEALSAQQHEMASLERTLAELRRNNRHLARRGQEIGGTLMDVQEKLAHTERELKRSGEDLARARQETTRASSQLRSLNGQLVRLGKEKLAATEETRQTRAGLETANGQLVKLRKETRFATHNAKRAYDQAKRAREEADGHKAKCQDLNAEIDTIIRNLTCLQFG